MVIAGAMLMVPSTASARVFVSVGIAPPLIPVYEQPLAPGYGYIWTPGYWAWGDNGYYWVDGAWVYPPYVDALWTPGYWGWGDGGYFWNAGYWGRSIGYYGGINYASATSAPASMVDIGTAAASSITAPTTTSGSMITTALSTTSRSEDSMVIPVEHRSPATRAVASTVATR